jgi:hypothetical protein
MLLRRIASRLLMILALATAPTVSACGQSRPQRTVVHHQPGKIEALREAQEKAQKQIEVEASANERRAEREQLLVRREAQREREDRSGAGR